MRNISIVHKIIVLAILLVIQAFVVSGCLLDANENERAEGQYSQFGTEEYVPLKILLIGDEPQDKKIVQEAVNEAFLKEINATLDIRYLSWADYRLKYSILLASSEQFDLIYTSDWCFYNSEAVRGSFFEMTDDFVNKYMVNALRVTPPEAIEQARIGGKLYMMPKSGADIGGESWIAIRGDLRLKYNLPVVKSIEDLENYFHTILANEKDIVPYAASGEVPLFSIFDGKKNNLVNVSIGYPWVTRYKSESDIPKPEDIRFLYMTPEYREFAIKMKQYADWGFWTKSAMSSVNRTRSSFENGTSASLIWNFTIFDAGRNLSQNNAQWFAEYIDLFPDSICRLTAYTNDGTAISAFSRYPERAALCIDILKSNIKLNELFMGGIEGKHWIDAGEGFYTPGPEADRYPWNHSQWAFNPLMELDRISTVLGKEELRFRDEQFSKTKNLVFTSFRFVHEPVKNIWTKILALESEYKSILELGLAEDPVAALEEFQSKMYDAGFQKVEEEFFSQYADWVESRTGEK